MSTSITRQELSALLASKSPPILVEALGAEFWADAHLPTAINIPADQVDRLAGHLLVDLDAQIVVYCSGTCENSEIVADRLIALGYRNIRVYEGGKEDWIEHGLPVDRNPDHPETSRAVRTDPKNNSDERISNEP